MVAKITVKVSGKAMYLRMEALRKSNASGVHADQNKRKDARAKRRFTRQEERNNGD